MAGAAQKPAKTPRRAFLNPSVRRCREQLAPAGYRSCCVEFVILPAGPSAGPIRDQYGLRRAFSRLR
jgi:hypothetical protein